MPNVNKVTDHIIFLHIDYTVHWHTHDINYKQNEILLYTSVAAGLSVKFKQMIHVSSIKIFYLLLSEIIFISFFIAYPCQVYLDNFINFRS